MTVESFSDHEFFLALKCQDPEAWRHVWDRVVLPECGVRSKDNSDYAFLDSIVQSAGMPAEVERAWASEIDRRRADYQTGRIQLVDGEEVFRKAMSKYA